MTLKFGELCGCRKLELILNKITFSFLISIHLIIIFFFLLMKRYLNSKKKKKNQALSRFDAFRSAFKNEAVFFFVFLILQVEI